LALCAPAKKAATATMARRRMYSIKGIGLFRPFYDGSYFG